MTFDEYQKAAAETAIYPAKYAGMYPALGLVGESGEVAEKVKKWLRDGTPPEDGLKKELGDVLWYIAAIARDFDLSLEEIARGNLTKLRDRKARNAIWGSGDDR